MKIVHPIAKNIKPNTFSFILLIISLIVLPFVFWPSSTIPFELPRVFFVHRFIELLVLTGVIFYKRKTTFSFAQPLSLLFLGWFISIILSLFTSVDSTKSIYGNIYRGDGLLTFLRLFGLSFAVASFMLTRMYPTVFYSIGFGAIGVSFLTIINWVLTLWHRPLFANWYGAQGTTFGQPEFLGGFLTIAIPSVLYMLSVFRLPSIQKYGILSVVLFAMILTQSWGSLLVTCLILCIWGVKKVSIPDRYKKVIAMGIVLIFLTIATIAWNSKNQLPLNISAESRQRIFIKMSKAVVERPVFGWGLANADHAFNAIDWPYHYEIDAYVDKAHSTILEMFVTTGIVGGMSYCLFLVCLLIQLWRQSKTSPMYWVLFLTSVAYTLHSQTNVVAIAEEVIFFSIVGASLRKDG